MSTMHQSEILINATQVGSKFLHEAYEFILNEQLELIECVRVASLIEGVVTPIAHYRQQLAHILFELNHVRVNPRVNNTHIIHLLTLALQKVGVRIQNPPAQDSMALCLHPLGEITDKVRFYFEADGQFIFLCPRAKLTVIHNPLKSYRPGQAL